MTLVHEVISKEDAEVALRSLARRYHEAVAAPEGDDGWERVLRTVPVGHSRSALGWIVHAGAALAAVGQAVAKLPMTSKPVLDLRPLRTRRAEPAASITLAVALKELTSASEMAAGAVDARRGEDWDRTFVFDETDMSVGQAVTTVVHELVKHLRDVEATIDAAVHH